MYKFLLFVLLLENAFEILVLSQTGLPQVSVLGLAHDMLLSEYLIGKAKLWTW